MDPLLAGLALGGSALAGYGASAPELLRKTPGPTSSGAAEQALLSILEGRTAGNPITSIDRSLISPDNINLRKFIRNSDQFASYQNRTPEQSPGYAINPNADRGLLAHELGHVEFGQTKAGNQLQAVRGNKKLGHALEAASLLAPAAFAAYGDDDTALASGALLATALAAPTLIDEFEGSRRGLGILNDAGMRATAGQRARMAGGLLSYAARPVALAAAGVGLGGLIAG
jgi:hypothetical protein